MKILNYFVLIFLLLSTASVLFARQAQDNDFQSWYARVNSVLQKNVESLNKNDVDILKEAKNRNANYFGADYQNSMKKLKQEVQQKLNHYDDFVKKTKEREIVEEQKQMQLEQTEGQLKKTESERDSVIDINTRLFQEVEKLKKNISKLTREKTSLEKANRKLLEENQVTSSMLEEVRRTMQRMQYILSMRTTDSEVAMQLPSSLKDSLENIECGVSESLMNNFMLTLRTMQNNEKYMDSVGKIYIDKRILPEQLKDYLDNGKKLSEQMKSSTTDCVRISGNKITESIDDFMLALENKGKSTSLGKILIIPGIILIVVLVVVIVIISRRKKAV